MAYFPRDLLADTLTALDRLALEPIRDDAWWRRLGNLVTTLTAYQHAAAAGDPEAIAAARDEAEHLDATGRLLTVAAADLVLGDACGTQQARLLEVAS